MRYSFTAILITLSMITGCSSTGASQQTMTAMNIVHQVDASKVSPVALADLNQSFLDKSETTNYQGVVVEVSGIVSSFKMTDEQLYIVTINENDNEAICVFDSSIAQEIGEGRTIAHGAELTIQGQCFGSGLFSSNPFTLDGCRIIE